MYVCVWVLCVCGCVPIQFSDTSQLGLVHFLLLKRKVELFSTDRLKHKKTTLPRRNRIAVKIEYKQGTGPSKELILRELCELSTKQGTKGSRD